MTNAPPICSRFQECSVRLAVSRAERDMSHRSQTSQEISTVQWLLCFYIIVAPISALWRENSAHNKGIEASRIFLEA
jgi:hypothetical protein